MADTAGLELQWWQVGGFVLDPLTAIALLRQVPLNSLRASSSLGDSLRYAAQIYRWSLALLARGKVLPGLYARNGGTESIWQPLLDSASDRARLAQFSQRMPSLWRAIATGLHPAEVPAAQAAFAEPQAVLLNCLANLTDVQMRDWLEPPASVSKGLLVYPWLEALSQAERQCELNGERERLNAALQTWQYPVQDYRVAPDTCELSTQSFYTSFVLEPPSVGEINWGKLDWKLNYSLRSAVDRGVVIDAATIWKQPVEQFEYQGQIVEQPQETLLKGLGLAASLYPPIAASLEQSQPTQCLLDPIQVYEFIRAGVWQLRDSGFDVVLPPGLDAGADEQRLGVKISASVRGKTGDRLNLHSLLDYKLDIAVGDQTLSRADFERLLEQKSPLVEVNGQWIALQPADVRAAQAILSSTDAADMTLTVEDALRLNTGDTKVLAKLPVVDFDAAGVLEDLLTNLHDNQAVKPIPTPKSFHGELRPYQARGVGWLAFLERWSLGACLADDMGLGKTPQLLAFLLHLRQQKRLKKPVLIVCPTSVLGNWEREARRFAPDLAVLLYHGDKRPKGKAFVNAMQDKDVAIASYALVQRDIKTLKGITWEGVVLDEAQNIKNPQAKQSQAVRELQTGFRIALTGTPVENRLTELWSILDFLNPGFLGTRQFFQRRFAMPIEKYGDRDSLQTLRSLVQPFILRRLKTDKEIIQDLPEKQEMTVFCGLSAEQARIYQKLVDNSLAEIEAAEGIKRRGLILTLLLRLKQVCNHPAQYLKESSLSRADRSGKLLRLQEMLEEAIAEGDRALLFTQFAEWGKLLQAYLSEKFSTEVLFLYGSTARDQREAMVDRFQNDPEGPQLFILSLKAGGTGLNLTRANHVFHVDRWWNPAVEDQATDRAFRIGQKQNVQVHKFVCTGTLEEKIDAIITSKRQLAEQTVDAGEQWLTEMDTDQLRNLLLLEREAALVDEESS
ncbi:MAG: DEAD/DEAH box helicase [Spirulinaceae cyanobacterium SM2_1_0]|nr:DEAD/DEAH box helicase [Spirulinaceae cyanobacterium SM2_1_0]